MRARRFVGAVFGLAALTGYAVACGSTDGDDGAGGGDVSLSAGQCRGDEDCSSEQWEYCRAPDESVGCGACYDGDCFIDDDCVASYGAGYVCGPLVGSCTCGHGGGECIVACTGPSDCQVTQECDAGGLCVPRPCSTDADCGDPAQRCNSGGTCVVTECVDDSGCDQANQRCNTGSYRCTQLPCTSDVDCGGYCVGERCFATPGVCEQPAA